MNIERPHYNGAPITGENLKLMMKAYYAEFDEGFDSSYDKTALELQLLIKKEALYHMYSMDSIEPICIKAKPFVLTAAVRTTRKTWVRPSVLQAILSHSLKGFSFKTENTGLQAFADNLGKLMAN